MEFTTTKEAQMFGYEILVKFADGGRQVFAFDAATIAEAFELLGTVEGSSETQLLAVIDRRPQEFLAW